jgi:hypothetical protein
MLLFAPGIPKPFFLKINIIIMQNDIYLNLNFNFFVTFHMYRNLPTCLGVINRFKSCIYFFFTSKLHAIISFREDQIRIKWIFLKMDVLKWVVEHFIQQNSLPFNAQSSMKPGEVSFKLYYGPCAIDYTVFENSSLHFPEHKRTLSESRLRSGGTGSTDFAEQWRH